MKKSILVVLMALILMFNMLGLSAFATGIDSAADGTTIETSGDSLFDFSESEDLAAGDLIDAEDVIVDLSTTDEATAEEETEKPNRAWFGIFAGGCVVVMVVGVIVMRRKKRS